MHASLHKSRFLLLFSFCISFLARAQELQVGTSSLSGDTMYITTPTKIFSKPGTTNEQVFLSFSKQKKLTALAIMVQAGKISGDKADEGDRLRLQLANGDTLTLRAVNLDMRDNDMMNYGSSFFCFYQLDDANILALKKSAVASVRLHHGSNDIDYAITGISVERIKKALNLIF